MLQEMISTMGPGDKLPTILELNQSLGMSVQTLHRAVQQLESHGVLQCLNGIGIFVASPQARALTGTIGLIGVYPEVKYFGYLLRGVERYTQGNKLRLMILGGCADLDARLCEQVDGVLMCDIDDHEERLKDLPPSLPRVSMFVREDNVSNVIADDYGGARQAVQHLVALGHKRIACLMEKDIHEPRLRYSGYHDALRACGIEVQPAWARLTKQVFSLKATGTDNSTTYLDWGRAQMQQWLLEGWLELGCTAIVVQNDTAAIGVMQVLQEAGLQVPQQISVQGFDGTELCDHVTPQLTSMKIPLAEIGYTAAELLYEQIRSGTREIRNIMLPLTLREGKSVSAPTP